MASMVRIVLHRIPSGKLTPSEPLAASSFDSHTQIEFSCGGGLRNCNSQAIFRRRRRRGTSSFQSSAGRTQATDGYSDEDLPGRLCLAGIRNADGRGAGEGRPNVSSAETNERARICGSRRLRRRRRLKLLAWFRSESLIFGKESERQGREERRRIRDAFLLKWEK